MTISKKLLLMTGLLIGSMQSVAVANDIADKDIRKVRHFANDLKAHPENAAEAQLSTLLTQLSDETTIDAYKPGVLWEISVLEKTLLSSLITILDKSDVTHEQKVIKMLACIAEHDAKIVPLINKEIVEAKKEKKKTKLVCLGLYFTSCLLIMARFMPRIHSVLLFSIPVPVAK